MWSPPKATICEVSGYEVQIWDLLDDSSSTVWIATDEAILSRDANRGYMNDQIVIVNAVAFASATMSPAP